ncbi:hypothetical protein C0995_007678 [Termitomyces sp. Mi166|nr:hypothetical protein C0995_007678 [Termitomyces sp. Mi166\
MSKKSAKSAPKDKQVATYHERDIVLGKVRGFPPWPGMVVDPDSVPPAVQQERPGKKSNFYCVQFFPAGDYEKLNTPRSAWLVPKDMSRLQHLEIEAYINEPFKKSGDLLAGYRTALDPAAWEAKRAAMLAAAAAAADEDDDEDAEDGDGDDAGEGEDVDELASEDGDGAAGKKKKTAPRKSLVATNSKKRKRESVDGKTRKGPKERERETKSKAKAVVPAKGAKGMSAKGRKAKSAAVVESEDDRADADDDADGEGDDLADRDRKKAASPPPAKKPRREDDADEQTTPPDTEAIRVRDWRHKLQKAFLSAKTTPDDSNRLNQDMPALHNLFSTVEAYDSMTVAYLQFSKIGKVMRHITLLEDKRVPRDAEFRFRARAQALVERWQSVLGAAKDVKGGAEKKEVGKEGKEKGVKEGEGERKEAGEDVNGVNGAATGAGEEAAKIEVNGTADVDMAVPTDVDAPGEADGEADVSGQADAPGEAEDAAMAEA